MVKKKSYNKKYQVVEFEKYHTDTHVTCKAIVGSLIWQEANKYKNKNTFLHK